MKISSLHFLAATPAQAEAACRGGVRWVQLRVKNASPEAWEQAARATQLVCRRYGAVLIINDNPALARAIGANGVHLGKADLAPAEARRLLGPAFIIGGTANTFADIEQLAAANVDYIGLGPFRFTTTKQNLSPILGLAGYQSLLAQVRAAGLTMPIVGIGGIALADVPSLLATGLHGVAVSGAIAQADDPVAAATMFVNHVQALPTSR
jgi:thiamine-phosphate pyrophosphorylase